MQTARSLVVERLATPRFMGKLVSKASCTWPILLGIPLVFWLVVLYGVNRLQAPVTLDAYEQFVPHWLIYAVFFTVTGLVLLASVISGWRFWNRLGQGVKRSGTFLQNLIPALLEIANHKRFATCGNEQLRRWGHFALMWGFVGAAVTSGFLVVEIYLLDAVLPLPLSHWVKILGNASAVSLVLGASILVLNRFQDDKPTNVTSAFDGFFIGVVVLLVLTGVLAEAGRFWFSPALACYIYIAHLTAVLTLFATFPYSKFAHLIYRTIAMVHERMVLAAASH